MPRRNLIRTDQYPYHITMRSNNREWFDIPLAKIWRFSLDSLSLANSKYPAQIQAYVLMSNHYHLLVWTPHSNLDKFMYEFNKKLSLKIRIEKKRINRIFGGRYKWSVVTDSEYYRKVLKYIYQNPTKVNLCKRCEQYKYSTLHYHYDGIELPFVLFNPIIGDHHQFLQWINKPENEIEDYKTKKALSRPVFKIPCQRSLKNNQVT